VASSEFILAGVVVPSLSWRSKRLVLTPLRRLLTGGRGKYLK
jgi:hypothetical protein